MEIIPNSILIPQSKMNVKPVYRVIFLFIFFISFSNFAFSANRYWVGMGLGNWNSTLSWSSVSGGLPGSSVPSVADVAIFDGGSFINCTIDANVNVSGFIVSGLYSGVINVNAGITTTVAAAGFSQSGGTFIGNNGNISINGPFNLAGGTFTTTTGTLQITGGFTYSSGTYNHNNGTISFSGTQTITGNTSFFNILFVANGTYTIASGTTITSISTVYINGASTCTINTGTLELKGDLTLINSANFAISGGTATFLFNGTGNQTISSSIASLVIGTNDRMCLLPNVEINKLSGALNLNGVINMSGTSWVTTLGNTLINPGTSTVNITSNITFSGQNLSLYNIHIMANGEIVTLSPATYTLTSTNNVTINGGSYYQINTGVLEILGDLTLMNTSTSAVNGGTGTFLFDGAGVQNINSSAASLNYICSLPNVQINKTSGALNLTGIINFNGSSWNTIAGASLINAGTATINILKTSILSGQNLSFYDIVVTGNFSIITISSGLVWTSTHLITLAGGTSWYQINTGTLNAKGDVLVTNTNASFNVGGNATLLFDGSANQLLTGSGVAFGGRLPQVQINKTGGTLTFANSIISIDNNWTYIAGDVDATSNASTVDFYRTAIVDGQGSSSTMVFNNVFISGLITLGGNMDVNGDFTIRTGTGNRLDVNLTSNYQLNIAGNWTNNNSVTASSFNQRNGKVVFDGGASQALNLDVPTNSETFYNLEMNNSSVGLTLNAPVVVSNAINFITGNIISSASAILFLNNAVTSTGANNNSFVSGPICKTGNQTFVFPTGKSTVFAPISISAPALTSNQFTAEYFQADPNTFYDVTSKDVSLQHISRCEYWTLDRTTGVSNVTVNLSWDTRSCGVTLLDDLRVAQWDGTLWRDKGNGGTTGTLVSGTVVSSSAVTSFGPFTLAANTIENPLPIELLSFSGTCNNNSIILNWSTASETNNDYFTIERSEDITNWQVIGTVDGAGSSTNILNYSFADSESSKGVFYYRLKQTDFDGNYKYSQIIEVERCNDLTVTDFEVYPNPTRGMLNFLFMEEYEEVKSIEVFNSLGEKVYHSERILSSIDISDNPEGIYFLHVNFTTKRITKKIVLGYQ